MGFYLIYGNIVLIIVLSLLYPSGQSEHRENNINSTPASNSLTSDPFERVTYQIIPSPNKTFGYKILIGERVLIRQTSVPGSSGIKGFENRKNAEEVAQLVISKILKKQFPPSISAQELRKLKVLE